MSTTNNIGITGTDGVIPIYNPDGRWTIWGLDDIFTGAAGANKYVPKLKDFVIDPETYTTYRVEFIDPVTLIPALNEIRPANMSFALSQTDVLFGVGPGTQADTYRVYLDTSVMPHILAVDSRLKIAGTLSNFAKIFKGSDLSGEGEVISRVYDGSGNFVSENVPLELVAIDSHNNYSIKAVSVCHTNADMVDGELVTVVIYNAAGHVVSKRQLLVENSAFIRSINVSQKYISHISLESAFLSSTVDNTINFPLNIPINALNLIGVVHYSNGDVLRLPVDGSKFNVYGLDQYISSIVGQKIDLVLNYGLESNEVAYAGVSADGHYVTEPYKLITVNPDNSYSVKLFGYPVWIDSANGYQMRWFLLNLDRNVFFEVTPHVVYSTNTGSFNPKGYGYLQRKTISINLRDVSGSFNNYIHSQSVDIVLNEEPNVNTTLDAWTMSLETVVDRPNYGLGLYATRIDATNISIASGITVESEWTQKHYLDTYPLLDRIVETSPPAPTHFVILLRGTETEFPMSDWNNGLDVGIDVNSLETVFIRFIKKTVSGDLHLSFGAVLVKEE